MARNNHHLFLGVDVGTGSVRAGLFTKSGGLIGHSGCPIQMWKPAGNFVEQSSDDIWLACCHAVKGALKQAAARAEDVQGIGFDATCSLVALDDGNKPVSISPSGRAAQNVIVWMDHRAIPQAEIINRTRHSVLRYVGGVISPEMQTPKLLWIKKNLPATWKKVGRFLDLPDYLTHRATGDDTRSLCTTVCKWTYLGHKGLDGSGWDVDFFKKIGLGDLAAQGFKRIGTRIRPMGEAVGRGLTNKSAIELGLRTGTPVSVSIIDAHAGGLGMLGAPMGKQKLNPSFLEKRLALIGGTSSCHMAVSLKPKFIKGIWGPYFSAMIPGLWLTEGGQSATGALIDHIIQTHASFPKLNAEAKQKGWTIYEILNARLKCLALKENLPFPAYLTCNLHVQPDFLGNRSPRANPTLKGMITGLGLSSSEDDLARLYLATIQALAYGARHILETMNQKGYLIENLFVCGGGAKNPVFLQEHADITGCTLVLPKEPEAVLLGSAVLGAVASGHYPSILAAMGAMNSVGKTITPTRGSTCLYHQLKYRVFHRLHDDFVGYHRIMNQHLEAVR